MIVAKVLLALAVLAYAVTLASGAVRRRLLERRIRGEDRPRLPPTWRPSGERHTYETRVLRDLRAERDRS